MKIPAQQKADNRCTLSGKLSEMKNILIFISAAILVSCQSQVTNSKRRGEALNLRGPWTRASGNGSFLVVRDTDIYYPQEKDSLPFTKSGDTLFVEQVRLGPFNPLLIHFKLTVQDDSLTEFVGDSTFTYWRPSRRDSAQHGLLR
jgi:hypothetical protein